MLHTTDVIEKRKNITIQIFKCKICQKNFTSKCQRNEHEGVSCGYKRNTIYHKLTYQKALLTFNMMIWNINDSVKEGDGERLIETNRYSLLYLKCFNHTKYSFTLLKLLFRIKLEPENAFNLIWGRFINYTGKKSSNISNDLHLEHLNNFLKDLLRSLQGNISEVCADRISKSLENTKSLIDNLESTYDTERNTQENRKFINKQ